MNARAGQRNNATGVLTLDVLLFVILTAVLCARPLISESFEHAVVGFLPEISSGTTPATTVWLDGILLLATAVVWTRYRRWRPPSLVLIAFVLLFIAVVISVTAAGNKRLAANAGAHLFVMAIAAAALVRVMRARWMVHVLIAAVLASGLTNATKCVSQRLGEFDATLEQWQQQKTTLVANGVDIDSPGIVNYERRLQSGETFGYLFHPNVTGSYLATCLLIVAGLLIGALRMPGVKLDQRAANALVAALLAVVLTVGLWLTGSMGAAVAGAIAGLLLLSLGLARRWVAGHTRAVFALLAAAYVGLIAVGAGYGLLKGTLPHTSLAFRWQYWQAAARACADEPLSGIGRENFRAAYLLYKPPESTEEVNNPHNLWLTLLVELGPLGLIAGVLLTAIMIQRAIRTLAQPGRHPPTHANQAAIIAVAAGVLVVQALFSGEPFGSPGILLLWTVYVAGIWLLAFGVAYSLIKQVDEHPDTAPWLVAGLVAALAAAFLHNLIGVSLFTPAGLAVLVVIAAGACALQQMSLPREAPRQRRAAVSPLVTALPVGLGTFLFLVYVVLVAWPTIHTEITLKRIKAELRGASSGAEAYRMLDRERQTLPPEPRLWDPTIPSWGAQIALQLAETRELSDELRVESFRLADAYASQAILRTPRSFKVRQLQARVRHGWAEHAKRRRMEADAALSVAISLYPASARARLAGADVQFQLCSRAITQHVKQLDRLRDANAAWTAALALYSTAPRARVAAADVQFQLWRGTADAQFGRSAIVNYDAALAIDAVRAPEVAAKLRSAVLRTIRARLNELRAAGLEPPGAAP